MDKTVAVIFYDIRMESSSCVLDAYFGHCYSRRPLSPNIFSTKYFDFISFLKFGDFLLSGEHHNVLAF